MGNKAAYGLWWKNAVIHYLDVELFADGDGDGCGDFPGLLTGKVDHLAGLVVNHTSDQHPWFQTARADERSPWRDSTSGPTSGPRAPGGGAPRRRGRPPMADLLGTRHREPASSGQPVTLRGVGYRWLRLPG